MNEYKQDEMFRLPSYGLPLTDYYKELKAMYSPCLDYYKKIKF